MEPVEYSKALEIISELLIAEYDAKRFATASVLLRALAKLSTKVGKQPCDFVCDDIREAIIDGPRRLRQQLEDPGSEVTPELFIAGLQKALLEPQERSARPMFEEILLEMWAMQRKKGADYGNGEDPLGNLTGAEEYNVPAWLSCILRMDDKRRRIASYVRKGKLENEGPADAFFDLAVYAVHAVRLFREWVARQNEISVTVTVENPVDAVMLEFEDETPDESE